MAPEDEPSTDDDDDDNRTHGELVDRFIALTRGETQRGKDATWSRLGEGSGYLGRCWRCQLGAVEEGSLDEVSGGSFVVKALPLRSSPMFSFVEEQRLFQAEVAFYQLITAAELRVKTPLYLFHTDSPRRLALEDKSHGTRCFGLQPGMSLRQCVAAVREVAKIHALTYGAAVERWPHMAQLLAEQAGLHAELLGACFIDGLRELRRRAPGLCEGEEAWRVLEGLGRRSAVLTQELAKGREQRLAHGDYWCGNVLFEEGRDVVAALLDFQFAAFKQLEWLDVIMMVASSLEADERRQGQEAVFRAYVEARGDLSEAEREDLLRDLRTASLPMGLCFAVGFGASAVLSGEGRVVRRIKELVDDYLATALGVVVEEGQEPVLTEVEALAV